MTNLSRTNRPSKRSKFYGRYGSYDLEVTAVAIVILALVFLPRYFRYGVDTISDFIELRFDTFTKRLVSLLFIFTYVVSFLPVVLYSGALVFNKIFNISEMLNISDMTAVVLISTFIGIFGIIYLFIGGLSLSAHSDSIYGIGLIIGDSPYLS